MKPNTHKTTRSEPLQKVKEGFERNHIDYTERKDRRCTILEVKGKTRGNDPEQTKKLPQ